MTCPYCGSEEIELTPSASGGAPEAKCAKCGAQLDEAALAAQVEAKRAQSRKGKVAAGVVAGALALGVLVGMARPHSRPAPVPAGERPRMSVPASKSVYVTRTGMKFHRSGCQYLREGRDRMTREEALARGYRACSVCQP